MIFRARSAKRNPRRLSVRRRLTLEREIGTESAPPSQVRHWVAQDSEKPAARRFSGRAAARPIADFTAARAVLLSRPVPVQGGGSVLMYFLPDLPYWLAGIVTTGADPLTPVSASSNTSF